MRRPRTRALLTLTIALGLVSGCDLAGRSKSYHPGTPRGPVARAVPDAAIELLTEPDVGTAPLTRLVQTARRSIDLVMFELTDQRFEQALAAASARGVRVRVVLDSGSYGSGSHSNAPAADYLNAHGVVAHGSSDRFARTHQKTLVVDGAVAAILTGNLTPVYYTTSRDFILIDRQPADVSAIESAFRADWRGRVVTTSQGTGDLVWSPGAETALVALIRGARRTLDVYSEEMSDRYIIRALCRAAKGGVAVRLLMTDQAMWHSAFAGLRACGVAVRTYPGTAAPYIHAKAMLADGRTAFVGSQNLSYASVASNRELGVEFDAADPVSRLSARFARDWAGARSPGP